MGTCCLDDLTTHTSLATQQQKASALSCIAFKLPEWKAVSGSVISHAIRVIENLFSLWAPMIFKIGITHDPVWRWSNPIYGYSSARDKWSNMVVYYCSSEPFGPAMLEAALIEKYHSTASLIWMCLLGFILLVMLMESGSHNTQTYIQNIKGWDVEHNMGNHFKSDTWYLLIICSLTGLQKTLFWFHKQSQRTSTSWFPNRIWSLAYVDTCVPSHHHCPRPMDAFR